MREALLECGGVPPLWSPGKPLDIFHPVQMDVTSNDEDPVLSGERGNPCAVGGNWGAAPLNFDRIAV